MKHIEQTLEKMGYQKLEEKEHLMFFEKWKEESNQTCLIYDKKRNEIRSMDCFVIENGVLKVEYHPHHSSVVKNESEMLKKLLLA